MIRFAGAVLAFSAFGAVPAAAQQAVPVHFDRGTSGTTITSSIVGRDYKDYKLGLKAGQTLSVSMKVTGGSPYFNIIEPNAGDVAIYNSSTDGQSYQGQTSQSGTYTIRVYQYRASARRGEKASYRLAIRAANAVMSHSHDALVPGTPYHATTRISCVSEPDKPMSLCEAGVTRRQSSATVHISTPDGGERTILYRDGRAVSSDSPAGMLVDHRGDLSIVRIGTVEVYEIPDGLVMGG